VINFFAAPNLINTLNRHPGLMFRMTIPHCDGVSVRHVGNSLLGSTKTALLTGTAVLGATATFLSFGAAAVPAVAIGTGVLAIGSSSVDAWNDKDWLTRQHSIESAVRFWSERYAQGGRRTLIKMDSWPHFTIAERTQDSLINQAMSFLPFRGDNPGLRTIANEDGMREAQIRSIKGYKAAGPGWSFRF